MSIRIASIRCVLSPPAALAPQPERPPLARRRAGADRRDGPHDLLHDAAGRSSTRALSAGAGEGIYYRQPCRATR